MKIFERNETTTEREEEFYGRVESILTPNIMSVMSVIGISGQFTVSLTGEGYVMIFEAAGMFEAAGIAVVDGHLVFQVKRLGEALPIGFILEEGS